jgi:serine/threonine protein kinase
MGWVDHGSPHFRASDLLAAEADPMLGRILDGRFRILDRLGAGSMGTVYRAIQAPIGRHVAIKILRSDRAVDEGSRARFLREARANSSLASPNTVTVFDFGQSESGDFFLAMELLEGESLGERIRRLGRLSPAEAIDTAMQALHSLAEAHAKGIIHRDLKPDNVFFAQAHANGKRGEIVKVLDFGIAKMMDSEGEHPMNAVETQAGTVFGTPRYMSPEQAQGKSLDARSDLYSLGVVLYHMMTGRPPFIDDDAIVVMARHIKTAPPAMSEVAPDANISPEVERAVMRMLSKEPGKRPQSAEAMLVELAQALEGVLATRSGGRSASGSSGEASLSDATTAGTPDTFDSGVIEAKKLPKSLKTIALGLAAALCALAFALVASSRSASSRDVPAPTTSAAGASTPMDTSVRTSPTVAPHDVAPAVPTASAVTTDLTSPNPIVSSIHAEPRSPAPPRRTPASAPKASGKAAVGYGYLE